eukprot:341429_1
MGSSTLPPTFKFKNRFRLKMNTSSTFIIQICNSIIQILSLLIMLINTTWIYYTGFYYYWLGAGTKQSYDTDLSSDTTFPPLRISKKDTDSIKLFKQNARIHLYSLASNFYLYSKPHYRKGSFKQDLTDNLRNVAIPRTGIPLSIFASNRIMALFFIFILYPLISFIAAIQKYITSPNNNTHIHSINYEYKIRLLTPNDWFNYWRLNCNIVGLHSYLHNMPTDYTMENKWTFLKTGKKLNVPVSPFIDNIASMVVKHRNEEGGMGIHFYKNAVNGGDWIIQKRLYNSKYIQSLLPKHAPLSTFRVITISHYAAKDWNNLTPKKSDIEALSCVFRAGRENARTDHDSILFDVDINTGKIKGGTTNEHWYQIGIKNGMNCKWRSYHNEYIKHPDDNMKIITGKYVENINEILKLVEESHLKLCPKVPICGWDVALVRGEKMPVCLLEVNLSCNFFRGTFDIKVYMDFIDNVFSQLQAKRLKMDGEKENEMVK